MQKKVLTTVLAASAIGAMVLSGCSSSKKTTGALGSSTPTAAASASAGGGSCNGTGTTYKIGYEGPLSVEWEDPGMDREYGAAEAARFTKTKMGFTSSGRGFDSAFAEAQAKKD